MRDLKNNLTSGKNIKNIQSRKGKSFGYQVLGFGAGGGASPFIVATGGTITESGNDKIHTFTGPGTFTVASAGNADGSNTVSYTVVAGGAGGGFFNGGGGGAGGFREGRTPQCSTSWAVSPLNAPAGLPVSAQGYPITVGGGGQEGSNPSSAGAVNAGSNSIFSTITSTGGGGGGTGNPPNRAGANGGSGGGGGSGAGAGGAGDTPAVTPAQGKNGGLASGSTCATALIGGGGGGATVIGTEGNFPNGAPGNGNGGAGATNSINATPTARAGGGGGGKAGNPGSGGAGGTGGGGAGGKCAVGNAAGTNTGGGGGGGGKNNGGAGGSGVVIIRYRFQ